MGWLDTDDSFPAGAEDPDVEAFLAGIDCYVIGSRTYEAALELGWPYGDTATVVLTRESRTSERASVSFRGGDLATIVGDLRAKHRRIWVGGGAAVARSLLQLDLADEVSLTIAPVILGGGLPYFDALGVSRPLHLEEATAYRNGLVELRYAIRRG